jgi:hypothetical protein
MTRFRMFVFRLYEQRQLRNWFYTVSFAIFVPVGYRFAVLAWQYGSWVDRPLAVIAGLLIGITTMVTLMRVWHVPPHQTAPPAALSAAAPPQAVKSLASELMTVARRRAAENRAMALEARALGSTTGRARYR